MTIQDSINVLTLYFLENTTLKYLDVRNLVPPEIQDKEAYYASLIGALNSPPMLALLETVTTTPNDINSLVYILKKPLFAIRQQVEISGIIALQIAQLVNSFVEGEINQSDPLNITEQDIQHLLNIINFLSNTEQSQEVPVRQK